MILTWILSSIGSFMNVGLSLTESMRLSFRGLTESRDHSPRTVSTTSEANVTVKISQLCVSLNVKLQQ